MRRPLAVQFVIALALFLFISSCSKSSSNPKPQNAPTITSLDVNQGPYYTNVTITGTGFGTNSDNVKIFFNGVSTFVFGHTSTQLYAFVPLGAGTGNVTVTVNGVTATGPIFTYQVADVLAPFVGGTQGAVNGMGALASFNGAYGLTIDATGNIFVADQGNSLIRKITPAGLVSTVAGTGVTGAANGIGVNASFNYPEGVAVDASGNVYVADTYNNLIRKITTDGNVTTLAGSGTKGYADGLGTMASFNMPSDIVVDANGNLYVTDRDNNRIREITPAGMVSTLAGNGSYFSMDGTGTAAGFGGPIDIAIDNANNLYVTQNDNLVRKITPGGIVTSIAGTPAAISELAPTSSFASPQGIVLDNNGNIYIESSLTYQIMKVTPDGQLTVFIGHNPIVTGNSAESYGIISNANFGGIFLAGIVIDKQGNVYISESDQILKIGLQ